MESDEKSTNIKMDTTLGNQDLGFLQQTVGAFVADYGWYLLLICVGVYLLIQELSKRRAGHKRSDAVPLDVGDQAAVVRRREALEASRRKMQEELDGKAALYREKEQKLEEEKRQQKIEMWESMKAGKSYKGHAKAAEQTTESSTSKVLKPKAEKKPLRSGGYNPLTGDGGGTCAWRPGRRGPSAGG